MSRVQLKTITCFKKQDTFNKDKPVIKLDGEIVWQATGFKKDTTRSLQTVDPYSFTKQVKLELYEQDRGSRDDFLGEKIIDDKPQNLGVRAARFVRKGADYEISYEVK